jgi:hypothetical protein
MGSYKRTVISADTALACARVTRDFTPRGLVAELVERGLKVDYLSVLGVCPCRATEVQKNVVARDRNHPDAAGRRVTIMALPASRR